MPNLTNLAPDQVRLLHRLAKADTSVPYGDPHAGALLMSGLAERLTTFGKLRITPAGRSALQQGSK